MKKILILYMPVLHSGYLKLLKSFEEGDVFLVGESILKELSLEKPYYGRDIRAFDSLTMRNMVVGILGSSFFNRLEIFSHQGATLFKSLGLESSLVMPDEDISRDIHKKYFSDIAVDFLPVFLRWDKQISQKETEVSPDRIVSTSDFHREMITRAQKEAQKSSDWWRQVGCFVLSKDNKIITGHNTHLPDSNNPNVLGDPRSNFNAGEDIDLCSAIHGEALVISKSAKEGISLRGAEMFVTTFPCPPCARSIGVSGIKKLYYKDGYSRLDGEDILKHFGVEIILVK